MATTTALELSCDRPGGTSGAFALLPRSRSRRVAAVLAELVLGAAVAGFLLASAEHDVGTDDALAALHERGAATVLEQLDRKGDALSAEDHRLRGHALAALGRNDDALLAWSAAAREGVVDDEMKRAALAFLGDERPANAVVLMRSLPDSSIVGELAGVARSGEWWARHRALALLEERGRLGVVDLEAFASRDLAEGDSCSRRKAGLEMLRRHGRTERALAALARAKSIDDGCLRRLLPPIERSLRARLEATQ